MDGIVNLNKPAGMTSARAVDQVRRATGIRKSGHAGTLDPAATGVLLVCCGKATKLVERIMDLPKVYCAAGRLDVTSFSLDSDSALELVEPRAIPSVSDIERVLLGLVGEIQQAPPNVSALKVGGVPAYKRARRGETLALPPRLVRIYSVELLGYAWPEVRFRVACGRGTYVRSIIRDLGIALGTGGCQTALEREAVGPFRVEAGMGIEQLRSAAAESVLIPLANAQAMF